MPLRYLEFIRSGDAGLLRPVFAHHARDMQSLYDLLGYLRRLAAAAMTVAALPADYDPVGLARLAELSGDSPEPVLQAAFEHTASLLDRQPEAGATAAALQQHPVLYSDLLRTGRLLVRSRKRRSDWLGALQLLQRMRSCFGTAHRWTAVELAKLYEHQLRDCTAALAVIDTLDEPPHHRRERLLRKLRRQA